MENKNQEKCLSCEVSEDTMDQLKKENKRILETRKNFKNMFAFFSKKCPACKMKLDQEKYYPKSFDKEFCSEECREKYRKKINSFKTGNNKSCH